MPTCAASVHRGGIWDPNSEVATEVANDPPIDAVQGWERYAAQSRPRRPVNAAGATTWFNWTQYPDHGPDDTILGDVRGCTVLELGSGNGANLAHLATLGANCIGVDLAPSWEYAAQQKWGHLSNIDFQTADAVNYLAASPILFDVVYSVFGATWFCDPDMLLPLVRKRLTACGIFAFSHMTPSDADTNAKKAVTRWDRPGPWWVEQLAAAGFATADYMTIAAPEGDQVPTLLLLATAT